MNQLQDNLTYLYDARPSPAREKRSDHELVEFLRSASDGPELRYLAEALKQAAAGTLIALDNRSLMHRELVRRGYRLRLPVPPPDLRKSTTLIVQAVGQGAGPFVQQVRQGLWTNDGLSLRAQFTLAVLPFLVERYNESYYPAFQLDFFHDFEDRSSSVSLGPFHLRNRPNGVTALRAFDVIEKCALFNLNPYAHRVMVRTAQFYSPVEIACELGVSSEAVADELTSSGYRFNLALEGTLS